ncbi:MFS transporter [Nocardia camponoti]|uniref:MFS transporter n=1 Tax=Nocardia camponoti TaxID=1616106 RepID=A0A917V5X5_9NOCA|nr:MFS transporter [Nocardia camponoti]GGK42092.1 hypothetical protein GCM10011591_12010 [Nocardia camponoti]
MTFLNRWRVIIAFALVGAATQLLWLTYAPVTTVAAEHFGVSESAIGWLANMFPLLYVVLAIPAGLALDRWFRPSLLAGAILTAIGADLRLLHDSFAAILAGQTVIAVAQPLVLNAIVGVAGRYLDVKDRPTGIAVGTASTFAGMAAAFVLGAIFPNPTQLTTLTAIGAVFATVAAFALAIELRRPARVGAVLPHEATSLGNAAPHATPAQLSAPSKAFPLDAPGEASPLAPREAAPLVSPDQALTTAVQPAAPGEASPLAPGEAAPLDAPGEAAPLGAPGEALTTAVQPAAPGSASSLTTLRATLADPYVRKLCATAFFPFGAFVALATFGQALLEPAGVSASAASVVLLLNVLAGVIGCAVVPVVVFRRDVEIKAIVAGLAASALACVLVAAVPGLLTSCAAFVLLGIALLPALPIALSLAERHTGEAEGTAAGLIWLTGNLGGLLVAAATGALVDHPAAAFTLCGLAAALGIPFALSLRRPHALARP